jgi:hypothetical protein
MSSMISLLSLGGKALWWACKASPEFVLGVGAYFTITTALPHIAYSGIKGVGRGLYTVVSRRKGDESYAVPLFYDEKYGEDTGLGPFVMLDT